MNAIKGLITGCVLSVLLWVVIVLAIGELIGEAAMALFKAVGL